MKTSKNDSIMTKYLSHHFLMLTYVLSELLKLVLKNKQLNFLIAEVVVVEVAVV